MTDKMEIIYTLLIIGVVILFMKFTGLLSFLFEKLKLLYEKIKILEAKINKAAIVEKRNSRSKKFYNKVQVSKRKSDEIV